MSRLPWDRPLAFVDTETTSLAPDRRVWEVGVILRPVEGTEVEALYRVSDVDLRRADAEALRIGGWADRGARPGAGVWLGPEAQIARLLSVLLDGVTLVGANPGFDAEGIRLMLDRVGLESPWHYLPVDVESMTAAHLGRQVHGLGDCARALGVTWDPAVRHTALGDARLARDVFDRIMQRTPQISTDPMLGPEPNIQPVANTGLTVAQILDRLNQSTTGRPGARGRSTR